ncbi:hypothetical protein BJG88_00150 [Staphylococcus nepalensis]|uniref:N-6 DNA methylase n=1 Tax=Staphylococcus nepalensis TaxID=214473 RepID=UPI000D58ABB0|nr:N-6 DNA methylase [Staphylococcus nepalensis]AWI43311.1 hypothetical protein BJG88_00150 [Staphylococcus nepalensis]
MNQFNFNERSQAIDLITEINIFLRDYNFIFKKAGGEATLKNNVTISGKKRKILFPDLMLYGNNQKSLVIQGWEIKMPDVEVTNQEFIDDAIYKAEAMKLNSTILWNFKDVVLYVKKDEKWEIVKTWTDLNRIKNRQDVETYKKDWISFLRNKLLKELNDFFYEGVLSTKDISEVTDNVTAHLINNYKEILAEHLKEVTLNNITIKAYIDKWWINAQKEFMSDEDDSFSAYSKMIILSWLTRISFCHIISDIHINARKIKDIESDVTPKKMNDLFKEITEESDFYTIFNNQKFDEFIPESLWSSLLDYNAFLNDKKLDHKSLQNMLELTVNRYKREIVGQFTTPEKLARLLVRMTIKNLDSSIIDPCCGSGTIPKQVQEYMNEANLSIEKVYDNIWASDKLRMPLQISNLALTSSNSMNQINKVFQSNALNLYPKQEISFVSPRDGEELFLELPKFLNIVSNLPFVPFEIIDINDMNRINEIKEKVFKESGINISKKSDYYYYLILHLSNLLGENGRLGLILSNSWLGTESGKILYKALNYYFNIDTILISEKGKWFQNADVMSSILILNHKKVANDAIRFIKLKESLKDLSYESIDELANDYILEEKSPYLSESSYSKEDIEFLQKLNVSLNSLFFDISWVTEVSNKLLPLTNIFNVIRGMRRGWDSLFYLPLNHNIEDAYVEPVIMSSKKIKGYKALPDGFAFCCSKSVQELKELDHQGALDWINRFVTGVNNVGKPLPEALAKKNHYWYEMKTEGSMAEIVTGINPDKRIFWSSLGKKSFINQRLIGLNKKENCQDELDLLLVLLNSVVGLFFIESIGFGRGLGALDISKNNIEKSYMLNPNLLNDEQKKSILNAFKNLDNKISGDTRIDLYHEKREEFDKIILECYGIGHLHSKIRSSLIEMMNARLRARG